MLLVCGEKHYAEQNERSIPQHRELPLSSHHEMHVGDCVPFFFCPRPVMRFVIHKKNDPDLLYRGGQDLIVDTLIKAAAHNSAIPAQAGIQHRKRALRAPLQEYPIQEGASRQALQCARSALYL
ncbi:MAG: DarT ssDNA thymidine ADP-ribosyltransferase family protein, partial [Gammaproteobacteria bacterium]|nr:DarT ssDNA thymidine ADP-ribosyltransferase family protein [Gammaproteobacteria bacterium]